MLNLDKDNVDFLVTAHMADEVRHVLGDVPRPAPAVGRKPRAAPRAIRVEKQR